MFILYIDIDNGAELGSATGAMAPLVFWSRSLKKSRKVSKSKSRSLEWHQLFLPSFGANAYVFKSNSLTGLFLQDQYYLPTYIRYIYTNFKKKTIVIFYTEILTGKVVFWCFFSSETSEKIHNSTFQVKILV